ncbi:hypothetical protein ACCO45_002174 [Purpureocillium lilacinum]|uniref:Uncharacterized protein n=1 Tax=Purpureocillium lilacinum TaxID=33203 RepID=A0ACC4E939_PURLI
MSGPLSLLAPRNRRRQGRVNRRGALGSATNHDNYIIPRAAPASWLSLHILGKEGIWGGGDSRAWLVRWLLPRDVVSTSFARQLGNEHPNGHVLLPTVWLNADSTTRAAPTAVGLSLHS